MLGPHGPRVTPLPPARPGSARLGPARPGLARPRDGSARLGIAWPGAARLGLAWLSPARFGLAWGPSPEWAKYFPPPGGGGSRKFSGWVNFAVPGLLVISLRAARPCGPPPPVHPRPCGFCVGGNIRCWGRVAPTWPCFHRLGPARPSLAWPGDGSARLGLAWPGAARLLSARLGPARLGSAQPGGQPQNRRNVSPSAWSPRGGHAAPTPNISPHVETTWFGVDGAGGLQGLAGCKQITSRLGTEGIDPAGKSTGAPPTWRPRGG